MPSTPRPRSFSSPRLPWVPVAVILGILTLAVGPAGSASATGPAPAAGDLRNFRFFSGSARGDDLNAFVWVGMGGGKTYGTFFDFFKQVGFRLEGPAIRSRSGNGALRLTARYPPDQRRIGSFTGPLKRGSLRGKWSAVGRNGNWRIGEATRDTQAMAELAGTYIEQSTLRAKRRLRIELNAETGAATFTLLRRGETFTLSGVWMADTESNLWLLGLNGDGTLGDLTPLDLNIRRLPVVAPFEKRPNGNIRLLNPLNNEDVFTTLEPETAAPE